MNIKKKLITLAMTCVLAMGMAITAFAAPINTDGVFADYIFGWGGNGVAMLKGHGVNRTMTVGTNNDTPDDHVWLPVLRNNGYVIYSGTTNSYCVNIRRVLINNTYYYCTGYYYEDATNGRDQRVRILNHGSYSTVRLADPLISGTWYMVADYSQPVQSSNVIWYTSASGSKAQWSS